ncbi:TetR/AcrR family transcriptional regulator [Nostoc sp.]|uniref:TetR/AcrR family transcriptional regulator n=1 Tax=Nostoc sp. TaxID=1180 RepID=UPI003FA5B335
MVAESGCKAAINFQTRTGDETGFCTGEIGNHVGDFFTPAVALEGDHTSHGVGKGTLRRVHVSIHRAGLDKESLFRKVLDRYATGPSAYLREALKEPTARQVAERMMHGVVDLGTDPRNPPGCLWVHGTLSCGDPADPIRQELSARRASSEASLYKRFEQAISEGDLPANSDPAALARFVVTVNCGISVLAATGATRTELLQVVETALQAWPQ